MGSKFANKIVLVAGGTGGLGRAVTLAFLQEGAQVIVTYMIPAELESLRQATGASFGSQFLDVTDEAAVRKMVEGIVGKHGRLDIMVNTIGGYVGGKALWETELATFQKMMALNVNAGFTLAKAVVPAMLRQKSGAIVNIAARAAFDHAAGAAAYAASKSAALAMIDCLAQDLKGTGVRANSVLPSIIDTEPNRRAMPDADFSKWPKPEEIAKVILFLCSDDASLVHGAAVPVYGSN